MQAAEAEVGAALGQCDAADRGGVGGKDAHAVLTGRAAPAGPQIAFDVTKENTLKNSRLLIDAGPKGTPDGFRVDMDGNLWCGWGMGEAGLDGVHVFNPAGKLIGRIDLPERCANLCFGGVHRNRLFMAASTSL